MPSSHINDRLGPGGLSTVAVFNSSDQLLDPDNNVVIYPDSAVAITGGSIAGVTLNTVGYTVATLPAGTVGQRAYVTDALTPTFLGAAVGGGSVVCPVFRNATTWVTA